MGNMSELSIAIAEVKRAADEVIAAANALMALCSGDDSTEKAVSPKNIKLEQVRAVLAEKSQDGFTAEVRSLLQKYGASRLSEIDPSHYADLLADAEELK